MFATSVNVAFFRSDGHLFVSEISLRLLGVKNIPCRVASLKDMKLKQKDWR